MKKGSLVVLLETKYGIPKGCVGEIMAIREGVPMVKFDAGFTYVDFDILEEANPRNVI